MNILFLAIAFFGGIAVILLFGYPGDGPKGYPTAYGNMERAAYPQTARGQR